MVMLSMVKITQNTETNLCVQHNFLVVVICSAYQPKGLISSEIPRYFYIEVKHRFSHGFRGHLDG